MLDKEHDTTCVMICTVMILSTIKTNLTKKMITSFQDGERYANKLIKDYAKKHAKKTLKVLDVGVGTGEVALRIIKDVPNIKFYGIDAVDNCEIKLAGFKKFNFDDEDFPYRKNTFDIVYSNQVIEHMLDKDHLLEEKYRVLKKGGLCITVTENIASLDNIISLILGQEPLCQHGAGTKYRINSIISPRFMNPMEKDYNHKYGHKNVTSYYSLIRAAKINGFKNVDIKSFGNINKIAEKLFPMYNRVALIYSIK
jgi:ubiquinone/menaquinone biosynthesis C-methylase UbiE